MVTFGSSLSILVRCLPGHIRQHVQLSLDDASSYADERTKVLSFESVTANWSTSRIHSEFGISTGTSAGTPGATTGPTPMEIDQMQWGQRQLNQFKGSHKGKGQGKGKYEFGKGKSKGKGKDKGKGKGKFNQNDQRPTNNCCLYCGKPGHWKTDCRKLQHDKQTGHVRQFEEPFASEPSVSSATSYRADTAYSLASTVPTSGLQTQASHVQAQAQPQIDIAAGGQIRRVEHVPLWDPACPEPDGEEYEFSDASFAFPNDDLQMSCIRAVTNVSHETDDCAADAAYMCDSVEVFDMTYSDIYDMWSCAPDLISHVRALESLGGT